jgi:hypothetical protein
MRPGNDRKIGFIALVVRPALLLNLPVQKTAQCLRNCRNYGKPRVGVNSRGSFKAARAASFLRILSRGKRMRNLVMSWNTNVGRLACRWRELERIESDAILHDLEPDDPSAMTPVGGGQA